MSNNMITALQQPEAYSHPVDSIKMLETHISWVFLTGKYAYKVKKPVNFGFIDYSSLDKRRYYCEQEIKLNKALADNIYLQILPIVKTATGYAIGAPGEAVEYALQMNQFSHGQLLNHLLTQHKLTAEIVEDLGVQLARFHLKAPHAAPDTPYGKPETVLQPVDENFMQARELLNTFNIANDTYLTPLVKLEERSAIEYQRLKPLLAQRKQEGFTRSCHGDVHLGNITLIDGKPVIFDCIEFNEYFIWTDVMGDVGFLTMDFYDHQREDFAWRFLNTYLTYTGDYAALAVLPYYFAYRAMVRAKIQLFSINPKDDEQKRQNYYQKFLNYVLLAQRYFDQKNPRIILMHGVSGSGKSTLATRLADQLGAIIIRSDVERKRLCHLQPDENSREKSADSIYTPEITKKTYERLEELATTITAAGYAVIVDATFLQTSKRQAFRDLAEKLKLPFTIIHCEAHEETLVARIKKQTTERHFSEAQDLAILHSQQQNSEPLTQEELLSTISVDTEQDLDFIIAQLLAFRLAPLGERPPR